MRLTILSLFFLAGCASSGDGFEPVRSLVEERTGQRVRWRTDSAEDAAADQAVRELLKSELTADAAVQIALLNNRRLQATYENLGIAQADVVQAGLLKNPVFDFAAKFPSGGGSVNLEMAVAQDFLDVLVLPLRQEIASMQMKAVEAQTAGAVLDVAGATRLAFLDVQAREQALAMRRQIVQTSELAYEFAERLRKAGNIRELDVSTERAALAQAKLEVALAAGELAQAREKLTAMMGLWGDDTQWTSASALPEPPTETVDLTDIEKRAIERSVDLAAQRVQRDALARQAGFTRSTALIDEAELGADAERDEGHWEAGPAFSLPIPIFDQGQARIAKASAQLRQAEANLTAQAVEIRSRARALRQRLQVTQDAVRFYKDEVLPLREKIVQDTLKQYNAMQVSTLQLLTARAQQIQANERYIEALHDYWRARAQLDLLLAGRMIDSDASTPSRGGGGSREMTAPSHD